METIINNINFTSILERLINSDLHLQCLAVRVMTDNELVNVGDYLNNSYHWEDDVKTDEELTGTSGIRFDFNIGLSDIDDEDDVADFYSNLQESLLRLTPYYTGTEQIVMITGPNSYEGNDLFERVVTDAKCAVIISN